MVTTSPVSTNPTKPSVAQELVSYVRDVARRFDAVCAKDIPLRAVLLTGSLSMYVKREGVHEPSWRSVPDANLYPLIEGTERDIVRAGAVLMRAIEDVARERNRRGVPLNVSVDVHPFAFAGNPEIVREGALNVQLTARVIDVNSVYGQHCWNAWLANHVVLVERAPGFVASLADRQRMPRDAAWVRDMYLALLSYTNALLVLPLYTTRPGTLFDEAYRYFKEISKDGLGIGLTDEEFASGKLYTLMFGKDPVAIRAFYEERYGAEAAALVGELQAVEDAYFAARARDRGLELAEKAIRLKELVFERGLRVRLAELEAKGERLSSAFGVQPLWF